MAKQKTGTIIKCARCNKEFYLIKSRMDLCRLHYCSITCKSKSHGEKVKKYPLLIGKCKFCLKDIIAKNSTFNKPNRKFCSYKCRTSWQNKYVPQSINQRTKTSIRISKFWKGRKRSEENREKMREINLGDKSHFWRGGLTDENRKQRNSFMHRQWRTSVYERDNYTCQVCKERGGKLNADHIKPWSIYPNLRFDISNGRTLCLECHKKTETFVVKSSVVRQNMKK